MGCFTSLHFELPRQVPGHDADGDQHVDQFPVFVLGWIVHGFQNLLSLAMFPGRWFFRSETKKSEKSFWRGEVGIFRKESGDMSAA